MAKTTTSKVTFLEAKNYTRGRTSGGRTVPIRLMVIHDMEIPESGTTAESCARMFATTTRNASAHYNIDCNTIVQSVRDGDTAYAAPGCNFDGLHFEHAGYASQGKREWLDEYGAAMLRISARLVAKKCRRYGVPPVHLTDEELAAGKRGIVGHYQVSRVYKRSTHTDPGPGFPWDTYMKMVKSEYKSQGAGRSSTLASAAITAVLVAAGFGGVALETGPAAPTKDPKPKPSATATATPEPTASTEGGTGTATPKPDPKPASKPAPKDGGPTGKFALASSHWYGTNDGSARSHSGARSKDRPAVRKIQTEVGAKADGRVGPASCAKIRVWKVKTGLKSRSCRVGPATWSVMVKK